MRGAFFREAAKPIPEKKVRAERGPQSVFPKTRFPEKRSQFICARRAQTPAEGLKPRQQSWRGEVRSSVGPSGVDVRPSPASTAAFALRHCEQRNNQQVPGASRGEAGRAAAGAHQKGEDGGILSSHFLLCESRRRRVRSCAVKLRTILPKVRP